MASPFDRTEQPQKKKKGRSPNFPAIDLQVAIERAQGLYDKENRHGAAVQTVLSHWGYSLKSSGGAQALAALKSFGLTFEEGMGSSRRIRLSDLAIKILLDKREGSKDRAAALQEAALAPKIHSELWEEFGGQLPSDENLRYTLLVDRLFTVNGADDFIREFQSTLSFSGLLSSGSISEPDGDESTTDNEQEQKDGGARTGGLQVQLPVRQEVKPGMKQDVFTLPEGDVMIQWPGQLSQRSFDRAKAWLDLMAMKLEDAIEETKGTDDPEAA